MADCAQNDGGTRWQTSSGAHERIIKRSANAGIDGIQLFSVPRMVEFEACRAVYAAEMRAMLAEMPDGLHELHKDVLRLVRAAMNPERYAGLRRDLPTRPLNERDAMHWAAERLGMTYADVSYLLAQVDTIESKGK